MAVTRVKLPPRPLKNDRRYPFQYRINGGISDSEQWCIDTFGLGSNNAKSRWRITRLPRTNMGLDWRQYNGPAAHYMLYFRHSEDALLFELKWL
jgi:hypothetical protein